MRSKLITSLAASVMGPHLPLSGPAMPAVRSFGSRTRTSQPVAQVAHRNFGIGRPAGVACIVRHGASAASGGMATDSSVPASVARNHLANDLRSAPAGLGRRSGAHAGFALADARCLRQPFGPKAALLA